MPRRPGVAMGIRLRAGAKGFTLIEVVAAVAIAAALAVAVYASLGGPTRAARMREVVEEVRFHDRLTREQSRRFDRPATLVFDLGRGTVTRTGGPPGVEGSSASLRIPEGHRIVELRLPGKIVRAGEIAVTCSARGQTPSYGILLAGPQEQRQWLLAIGLTGEIVEVEDEREIQQVFDAISEDRSHAD